MSLYRWKFILRSARSFHKAQLNEPRMQPKFTIRQSIEAAQDAVNEYLQGSGV